MQQNSAVLLALSNHDAGLVPPGVFHRHNTLAGPRGGQPLLRHHGLRVQGVAVEQRVREGNVSHAQLRHDGALGQLRHRLAHHGGQGEHGVHEALAKGLLSTPGRIQVQGLGVHGHGGEQDVVRFGHGAPGPVPVHGADLDSSSKYRPRWVTTWTRVVSGRPGSTEALFARDPA